MTEPDKTKSDEKESDKSKAVPTWSLRSLRIPPRLFGHARTSTVLFGICFVLTGLLYNQLSAANQGEQNGPTAIDPSQFQTDPSQFQTGPSQNDPRTYNPTSTSLMPTTPPPTSTGNSGDASATPDSSTGGIETSPSLVPTFVPGLTVPPDLRSLFPPAPAAPKETAAP